MIVQLDNSNIQPNRKCIIQIKSSDNGYNCILANGNNHISYPTLIPEHPDKTLFTLLLHVDGQICLRTYSYFPLQIQSSTQTIKAYVDDCLFFFYNIENLRIHSMINTIQTYFYFNVIEYEQIDQSTLSFFSIPSHCLINRPIISQQTEKEMEVFIKYNHLFVPPQSKDEREVVPVLMNKKRERESEKEKEIKDECVICLEEKSLPAILDKCKHTFCEKCIVDWSKSSSECPICKSLFKKIILEGKSEKVKRITVEPKKFKYEAEDNEDENWLNNIAESCMICKKNDDNYLMLICDKCNYNVCHTYCANLDSIPEGDWYCKKCEKRAKRNQSKVKKRIIKKDKRVPRNESKRQLRSNHN